MKSETRDKVFYSDILVRFSHCDPAGIIFYPHYFVMFNGLVEDWFNRSLNINYADFITNRRLGLPMVNIQCNFVAPSMIGEIITLSLEVEHIGKSSIRLFAQALFAEKTRVSAKLTICVNSFATGRAVPIPDDLRQRLTAFTTGRLGRQEPQAKFQNCSAPSAIPG